MSDSLDELAPMTNFTVKSKHIFGLSEETKTLMKQRDEAREMVKKEIKVFLRLRNLNKLLLLLLLLLFVVT